jgi:WD40 repeat protein
LVLLFWAARATPAAQGAFVVQRSHHGAAQFLRLSADGHWAASGDFTKLGLRIWDLVDEALVATIPVEIASCDFSPDGRLLVVASELRGDRPPELWIYRTDALDGAPLAHKVLEKGWDVLDVAFFPNRADVAITGGARVSVWKDAARNGPVVPVSDHEKHGPLHLTGHALGFSRDGSRWLAGGTVWSGDTFAPVASIDVGGEPVGISPDGELVYVLLPGIIEAVRGGVGTFSIARHELVARYRPPRKDVDRDVKSVAVSSDGAVYLWNQDNAHAGTLFQLGAHEGRRLAAESGSMVALATGSRRLAYFKDSWVHVASLDGGPEKVLTGAAALGRRVAIADTPARLAVEINSLRKGSGQAVITTNLESGALLGRFEVPVDNGDHLMLGITDAGATGASGGRMFMTRWGGVTVTDLVGPRPLASWSFMHPETAELAPDGGILYVRDEGDRVHAPSEPPRTAVWDLAELRRLSFSAPQARHISAEDMALAPDGKRMLLCTKEGAVLWDVRLDRPAVKLLATRRPDAETLEALSVSPSAAALSRDGRYAACAGRGRIPTIWQVAQRREVWTGIDLPPAVEELYSVEFSFLAEGRLVAINALGSWRVPIGILLALPSGKALPLPDDVRRVTATEDGKIVAASLDDSVVLLDAITGARVARWPRPERAVHQLALSPDGSALLEEASGPAPFWLATRADSAADAAPSWSAGELAQHGFDFSYPTARFIEGGKVLLAVSDQIMLYRVRDRAALEVIYDERPSGKGAVVTIASDGRFDGPSGSLDLLRMRGAGGHLVAVSTGTPGYTPGLQQQWMAAAAAR